jgi:RNA polymerase sigma factor (sigma-70 family)
VVVANHIEYRDKKFFNRYFMTNHGKNLASCRTETAGNSSSDGQMAAPLSFEDLFEKYLPAVVRILTRVLEDPAEAEDVAMELFLRLYQNPPGQNKDFNWGGWLYRVATRLGFNQRRSRSRRLHYEQEAATQHPMESAWADPSTELWQQEKIQQVRISLQKMKPRSAQLLLLRHSGMSYAELASALGVSAGSVGTLLIRAEREFGKLYLTGKGA